MKITDSFDDVERIVKMYGTRDPFELIAQSNKRINLHMSRVYEPDGLKGYACIVNRVGMVVINDFLPDEEKVVVGAHELGHIFRHELALRVAPMKDFDIYAATGKLEREANFFAADFLISDERALDEIHSCGADFFSTAKKLCVPSPFFAFKLYSLVQRGTPMRMPVDLDNSFLKSKR